MKVGMERGAKLALRVAAVIALLTGPAMAQYASPPVSQQPLPPPTQGPPAQVPSAQVPPAQVPSQPPPGQTMQEAPPQPAPANQYSSNELIDAGHRFFGGVSRGLAMVVEKAASQWGQPNGYVLGEEAGGAFVGGLRYGDGTLYTKNAGDLRVFWQGPSVGFDAGADGARTMMLVYNLPRTEAIFDRFGGINGSAYFIGGFGMTALTSNNIVLVPIRSGVGFRLGANLGYLKFTERPTWNPF
jgi:hypothetical protein